jgi:methylmalonyl-CoA mutase
LPIISAAENFPEIAKPTYYGGYLQNDKAKIPVLGIRRNWRFGKSSLVDELVRRFLFIFQTNWFCLCKIRQNEKKQERFLN